jgi:thioredoxin-like negative regulator of GroEL
LPTLVDQVCRAENAAIAVQSSRASAEGSLGEVSFDTSLFLLYRQVVAADAIMRPTEELEQLENQTSADRSAIARGHRIAVERLTAIATHVHAIERCAREAADIDAALDARDRLGANQSRSAALRAQINSTVTGPHSADHTEFADTEAIQARVDAFHSVYPTVEEPGG